MTTGPVMAPPRVEDQDLIDRIIADQVGRPGALLGILEKLQDHNRHKYLPMETLEYVAMRTGVPQSQLYGVVTFYSFFTMTPRGRHTVRVCLGTACYVRGGKALADALKKEFGIEEGETTPDRRFTFESVRCLGACGLGPVVVVNEDVHGRMKPSKLKDVLSQYN